MQIVKTKEDLNQSLNTLRQGGKTVGFVPTMGFLHEGHLSLMRRARTENDIVVVSVFVNPTQFGPSEDLDAYPRDARRDQELMHDEGVDLAFFPEVAQLYPEGFTTYVEVQGPMTEIMCGESRPIHFRGVATVVAKLFNMVKPHQAYFGQKDAQQVAIIEQMARDLDFDLQVVACPTVRESDGLAKSSRNSYLSPRHRADAVVLSQSLFEAQASITEGERNAKTIIRQIQSRLQGKKDVAIDYVVIVDARSLAPMDTVSGDILIAAAVRLGNTRLIDNVRVRI